MFRSVCPRSLIALTGGAQQHLPSRANVGSLKMCIPPADLCLFLNPLPVQGNQQYLPARLDVNAPDLYLPTVSLWTYIIGVLLMRLLQHKYKPDLMYTTVSGTPV